MTETFIKERKHNLTGKVEPVGIDDASAFLGRFENGSLGDCSKRRATRAATRRSTRSRSTASTRRHAGICTICIASSTSITATKGACAAGATSTSPTATTYMKHWWVPGLQIGYEHTFIHQFADFLEALGDRARAVAPTFRDGARDRLRHRRGPKSARSGRWETVGVAQQAGAL